MSVRTARLLMMVGLLLMLGAALVVVWASW